MRCFYPVLLLGLTASALGAPRNSAHVVKESISLPTGWVKHSNPSPHHVISLRIGLPQPNFPTLERHLYEVSDPTHARYGQHLSKEEVEDLVAPYPHSLNAVNDWLSTYGLGEDHIDRSPAKDWITITIPLSLVEEMLDTVSPFCRRNLKTCRSRRIRNTTCTNTRRMAIILLGQQAIVFQSIYTSISIPFNQQPSLDVSSPRSPTSYGWAKTRRNLKCLRLPHP